ncbi:polymorphic toxin-type HINT domain-containing protein [Paenibacillus sp. ISL-20]|uniref:polymorphic toxin-type HINT domain-containing protein n=1 Tax=Paenibacillus sp. ISL-20 TaxID=2819163 RepID=UPI001BE67643|nr:polymorphic toxin-type HINT domain-containing protein [Paenibacillus sp. ISL-20]MBT2765493.1 hypothetical protein [Paenibacillus sp. ISL-20]
MKLHGFNHELFQQTGECLRVIRLELTELNLEETYHIQVEDTVIVTTAEHPFWVIGKGWVESRDLKAGDRLVNDEGIEYVIEKIEIKQETIRVYNFSVGDYHTYFVTGLKLWTHNCGGSGGRGAGGGAGGSGGFVPRPGGGGGTSLPKKVTSPKQKQKPVVNSVIGLMRRVQQIFLQRWRKSSLVSMKFRYHHLLNQEDTCQMVLK